MCSIKNYINETRSQEVDRLIQEYVDDLSSEGLFVEFGRIGIHTTYALIYNTEKDIEILGYTFIKNMEYYKENVGKLKALQQALARKGMSDTQSN